MAEIKYVPIFLPVGFNFGIPPAKSPPNPNPLCTGSVVALEVILPPNLILALLFEFDVFPKTTSLTFYLTLMSYFLPEIMGALLSTVIVFLSFVPCLID